MIRQEVQFDPQADDCEGLSDTKSLTAVKQSQFVLQAELQIVVNMVTTSDFTTKWVF